MVSTCNVLFGLSETWLDSDRDGKSGGGVLVYVSNGVKSVRRSDLESSSVVWVEVKAGDMKFLIGNIYR